MALCKLCNKENKRNSSFCSTNCFNKGTKTKEVSGFRQCFLCAFKFPYRNTLLKRGMGSVRSGGVGKKNQKFCSQKCSIEYRNKYENPASTPNGRKKISESAKKRDHSFLRTLEARAKQRKTITGSGHWNWQGGKTGELRKIRNSLEIKLWRKQVFERDNYSCTLCGARNGRGVKAELNADHIKPFALFPESRFDVLNGRTLCLPCHIKTPTFAGRGNKRVKVKSL